MSQRTPNIFVFVFVDSLRTYYIFHIGSIIFHYPYLLLRVLVWNWMPHIYHFRLFRITLHVLPPVGQPRKGWIVSFIPSMTSANLSPSKCGNSVTSTPIAIGEHMTGNVKAHTSVKSPSIPCIPNFTFSQVCFLNCSSPICLNLKSPFHWLIALTSTSNYL